MFELRHLKHFIAVAEELSFRKAAARLNMSQPPLSVSIRALEKIVGQVLLNRSKHDVQLSPAGRLFLSEARLILAATERSIRVANHAKTGILHLSHLGSATLSILPKLLRNFREGYPTVDLHVVMAGTVRQLEMLQRGDVDLALIRVPIDDARGLRITVLCPDRMVVAMPADHPMANLKSVRIAMLAGQNFIGYAPPEAQMLEGVFLSACQRSGFFPRVVQHAPQMFTKLSFVASGRGISIVPETMRAVNMQNVVYVDLDEGATPLGYSLALAYNENAENPSIAAFVGASLYLMSRSVPDQRP